jgi:hypothetical protein
MAIFGYKSFTLPRRTFSIWYAVVRFQAFRLKLSHNSRVPISGIDSSKRNAIKNHG